MYGSIKNSIRAILTHLFGSSISKRRASSPTGKRRAAVYARSATFTAGENSIARQTVAAVEYARRNDLEVVAAHVDDGVSGLAIDRPGLGRIWDDVASKRISVVIVEDLERISRSATILFDVHRRLTAAGVQLHVHREGVVDMHRVAYAAVLQTRDDGEDPASRCLPVGGSSLDLNVGSSGGTMFIGDGAGSRSVRIASKARGRRKFRNRVGGKPVSPAMEAAAVEAFLAGADVTRLGRSLADF